MPKHIAMAGLLAALACAPAAVPGICSSDADCKADTRCVNAVCVPAFTPALAAALDGGTEVAGTYWIASSKALTIRAQPKIPGGVASVTAALSPADASVPSTISFAPSEDGSTWTATIGGTVSLAPRPYTVAIQAQGKAASQSAAASVAFSVAGSGPVISVDASSEWYLSSQTAKLSATVVDPGGPGVAGVTWKVGAASILGTGSASSYSAQVPLTAFAGDQGSEPYQVSAADVTGNITTATGSLLIDDVAPAIALNWLSQSGGGAPDLSGNLAAAWWPDGTTDASTDDVYVAATISDGGSGVDPSSVVLVVGTTPVPSTAGPDSAGRYLFHFLTGNVAPPGAVSALPLQIAAADEVGNRSQQPLGHLQVDGVPPAIGGMTLPATPANSNGWYTSGGPIAVGVQASDQGSGIASVFMEASSTSALPLPTTFVDCISPGMSDFTCTLPLPSPGEGTASITFIATDRVGNTTVYPGTQVIQFDNVPPVISKVQVTTIPDAGSNWYSGTGSNLDVAASITDGGSGVASATVVAGQSGAIPGSRGSDGLWHFSVPRSVQPVGKEGTVPLVVTATDVAGNRATASGTVQIDKAPPMVGASIQYPAAQSGCASGVQQCGHDGSHFWRSDDIVIAVTVTDGGAGPAGASWSEGGAGATVTQAASSSGSSATYTVAIPAASINDCVWDSSGNCTVTVTLHGLDAAGNPSPTSSVAVAITRLKWIAPMQFNFAGSFPGPPVNAKGGLFLSEYSSISNSYAVELMDAAGRTSPLSLSSGTWISGLALDGGAGLVVSTYPSIFTVPPPGSSVPACKVTTDGSGKVYGNGSYWTWLGTGSVSFGTVALYKGQSGSLAAFAANYNDCSSTTCTSASTLLIADLARCTLVTSTRLNSLPSSLAPLISQVSPGGAATLFFAGTTPQRVDYTPGGAPEFTVRSAYFVKDVNEPMAMGNGALLAAAYDSNSSRYEVMGITPGPSNFGGDYWTLPIPAGGRGAAITAAGNTGYMFTGNSFLMFSYSGNSATPEPSSIPVGCGWMPPLIGADGTLYAAASPSCTGTYSVVAFPSDASKVLWSYPLPSNSSVFSSPSLANDGTLYVPYTLCGGTSCSGSEVIALITDSAAGLMKAGGGAWPAVAADRCNSGNASFTCP